MILALPRRWGMAKQVLDVTYQIHKTGTDGPSDDLLHAIVVIDVGAVDPIVYDAAGKAAVVAVLERNAILRPGEVIEVLAIGAVPFFYQLLQSLDGFFEANQIQPEPIFQ
jgi:hypothetical protein